MALFEVTDYDRAFYETHLKDFLPRKIFDIHCHIYLEKFRLAKTGDPSKRVTA
ncbi:MAG: hypothetical protein HFI30_06770 [Lachnospiraceae bacterium]|jgi:hypothetical protein|nr:hypothetical protein [Lachnospiraceae bacterium]